MRFGARVSKTPCQNRNPWVQGLARCFAYACTKSHPNRSKFGGDIVQIGAHQFSLSSINFVINSTPQGPWERKDQKTRVTPYLSWNIHDVFHASLLLPYRETTAHGPNFTCPPPDLIKDQEEYEVEAIVNHRHHGRRRQLQYLIKWKGYPSSDNTWEAADDVHADDLLKSYHRRHPLKSLKGGARQGTKE